MGKMSRAMFQAGGIYNPTNEILIKQLRKQAKLKLMIENEGNEPLYEEIEEEVETALKKLAKLLVNGK